MIPLSLLRRFVLLAFLDYFLSLYHFSVQHYGVLSVYRGRLPHGQEGSRAAALGLVGVHWCVGIFSVAMDYLNGEFDPYEIFGNAPLLSESAMNGLRLGLSALVVVAWVLTLRKYVQRQQGIARILYLSTLCYLTIVSFYLEPLLYFFAVQAQHWFVSLGLTTHMAANSPFEPRDSPIGPGIGRGPGSMHELLVHCWSWSCCRSA